MSPALKSSPLQEVYNHPWGDFRLYLKREDLLLPAGGNKVRRFDAFFQQAGHLSAVMTLSNPGSHSFHVLTRYLKPQSKEPGCDRLILLERDIPLTPYHHKRRQLYSDNPRIEIIQGNLLYLLFRQHALQKQGVTKIGIGGHVDILPNPYIPVMSQCVEQLLAQGIFNNVSHYFPIASGNMADGFLEYLKTAALDSHKLYGLQTGAPVSRLLLWKKFHRNKQISLLKAQPLSYQRYQDLATNFYQVTGVWLDPVHTIQFMKVLRRSSDITSRNIVLWMTQPFIEELIL